MSDTGFPIRNLSEMYSQHTADEVQNLLAPYIREATFTIYGSDLRIRYVELSDAYALLKRVMERPQ
jgi:hypothetical protein